MSTGQGYADWQRTSQWEGAPFLNLDSFAWTPQVTQGPFYTATWESLLVVGGPGSGLAQLLLSWSVDQAGNQVTSQTSYNFSQGVTAFDAIANAGTWLYATNLPNVGAFAPTAGPLRLIPRQGTARVPVQPAYNRILEMPGTSVGAAATFSIFANVLTTGPAVLTVYCTGSPWSASLSYLDNINNTHTFWWGQSPPNQVKGNFSLSVPAGVARLDITNNSAGALTFGATLVMYR